MERSRKQINSCIINGNVMIITYAKSRQNKEISAMEQDTMIVIGIGILAYVLAFCAFTLLTRDE